MTMQLEKQRMFIVNGYYTPEEISVIKKEGKVYLYSYGIENEDDYSKPYGDMRFFETKEAADEYYSNIMSEINIEKTKKYIQWLLENSDDRLESILPESILKAWRGRAAVKKFSFWDIQFLQKALNGILNIDGVSFRTSDISKVKYGNKWVSVILKNGENITPRNEVEVFVIESIFGKNSSGISYKDLEKPADYTD